MSLYPKALSLEPNYPSQHGSSVADLPLVVFNSAPLPPTRGSSCSLDMIAAIQEEPSWTGPSTLERLSCMSP